MLFLRRYTLKRTVVHAEGKKKTADLEKGANASVGDAEINEAEVGETGSGSVAAEGGAGDGDDSSTEPPRASSVKELKSDISV